MKKMTLGMTLGRNINGKLVGLFLGGIVATLNTAQADDGVLLDFQALTPEAAMKVAMETMNSCRESGFQVGVAVVDRGGNLQAFVKDRFAGPHTQETAFKKAWTAVSFKADTMALADLTQAGSEASGVRFISGAIMAGGGVPIRAAGSLVGAVGVSGAPSGEADHICGEAGIESILEDLEF